MRTRKYFDAKWIIIIIILLVVCIWFMWLCADCSSMLQSKQSHKFNNWKKKKSIALIHLLNRNEMWNCKSSCWLLSCVFFSSTHSIDFWLKIWLMKNSYGCTLHTKYYCIVSFSNSCTLGIRWKKKSQSGKIRKFIFIEL